MRDDRCELLRLDISRAAAVRRLSRASMWVSPRRTGPAGLRIRLG